MHSTDIRYFLAVATAGSLSGASQQLFVAVSAISRQIQRLEERIGAPLFERHARGMYLTDAGRLLEKQVRKSMMDMDSVIAEIVGMKEQRQTTIHVACTEGMSFNTLPTLLSRFQQRHPQVSFQLHVGTGSQVSHMVRHGEVDVALQFAMAPEQGVDVLLSLPAPLLLLMAREHPLADKEVLLAELPAYPLALPGPSTTLRQLFDLSCRMKGIFLEPILSCDNFTTLYHYILSMPHAIAACSFYSVMYKFPDAPIRLKAPDAELPGQRFLQVQKQTSLTFSAAQQQFIDFMLAELHQAQEYYLTQLAGR